MDTFEYIFTSNTDDRYIVKILQDYSLFQKFQGLLDIHVVDIPICIDACGNDMYIHLIAREEHEKDAELIKQDVLAGFSK